MKIQVVGARGMLGSAVLQAVKDAGHEPITALFADITTCSVTGEVVINCAGIVKQRQVPDSQFVMVNGYGPQRLAEACDGIGARLIQVSTDCVFAGETRYGHGEPDTPDGHGIYTVSKLAGEVTRAPHLTVRTSFVGFGKRGLIHDLFEQRGQTVKASVNKLWTGHTVLAIARLLVTLAARPDITGLLHVPAHEGSLTRPRLIQFISDYFSLGIAVESNNEPTEDRRLVSERWFGLKLSDLPTLRDQFDEMTLPENVP